MEGRKKENIFYAISFALISYFAVATMGVFVKFLPSDIHLSTSLFIQYFVSFLLVLSIILKQEKGYLKTQKPLLHVIRVLAGIATFGLFFLSLNDISLVNAIVLRSTTPFFIPLILFFWKGQRLSPALWIAIVIGFVGILLIIKPSFHHLNQGMLYGLASGFAMAIAALAVRRMNRTEAPYRSLFYYFLGATVVLTPFFLYDLSSFYAAVTLNVMLLLIGIGVCMFVLQLTLIKAFLYGKPSVLGPIAYTAILYSGFYDWFIWHHFPDYLTLIGIVLIVLTTFIILWNEHNVEKNISPHS